MTLNKTPGDQATWLFWLEHAYISGEVSRLKSVHSWCDSKVLAQGLICDPVEGSSAMLS